MTKPIVVKSISIISITVLLKQNSARSEESLRFIYLADWHAAK